MVRQSGQPVEQHREVLLENKTAPEFCEWDNAADTALT